MKVILREDVKGLGTAGDVKNVTDGYARNFLLPRGIVMTADKANMSRWEHEKKLLEKKRAAQLEKARDRAAELEKVSCTISVETGEDNKMFGSVTALHIADNLKESGFTVDKKDILLADPIKELGAYVVDVRISPQVAAKVKVWVVGQK